MSAEGREGWVLGKDGRDVGGKGKGSDSGGTICPSDLRTRNGWRAMRSRTE